MCAIVQGSNYDRYLGETPDIAHAGIDVNMTITTESVTIVSMDSREVNYLIIYALVRQ